MIRTKNRAGTADHVGKGRSGKLRRAALLGSAGLAALVLTGTATTPAQADGPLLYAADYSGAGYFKSHGDYFYINDLKADGHSAVIQWRTSTRSGDDWDVNGANNGWTVVNRNFPELSVLQYRVCWGEWSTQYIHGPSCSDWWETVT
ncbi:hypothetical protein ACWDR0_22560 [Streptomyces sp. NPDC003691]